MNTESIISAHRIENPADASLIRLASAAVGSGETAEVLLKRENLPNSADRVLAAAIIDAVRVSKPPAAPGPIAPKSLKWQGVSAVLALALAGTVFYLVSSRREISELSGQAIESRKEISRVRSETDQKLEALNQQFAKQVESFQKQVAEAQNLVSTQSASAALREKEQTKLFTEQIQRQFEEAMKITAENSELKIELAKFRSGKPATP